MARIISLGCEVSEAYRRYAAVHSALFGIPSFRQVFNTLTGRRLRRAYTEHQRVLVELLGQLEALERQIGTVERREKPVRGSEEMHRVLLEYIHALVKVIAGLAAMCEHLMHDEQAYRAVDGTAGSRFNRDRVGYDYALHDLERLGTKLNHLFSTY